MKQHIITLVIFALVGLPTIGIFAIELEAQAFSVAYMAVTCYICKRTRIGRRFVKRMDALCAIL